MSLNSKIEGIIASPATSEDKIQQIDETITVQNVFDVTLSLADEIHLAVTLIKIERALSVQPLPEANRIFEKAPNIFHFLKSKGIDQNDYLKAFTKIKFTDLQGDYQLLDNLFFDSIIDLVNKKILLSNNIPHEFESLASLINNKALELTLVSGSDFRKDMVWEFMQRCLTAQDLDPVTRDISQLLSNKRLVPVSTFEQFLGGIQYSMVINHLNRKTLVDNFMEDNIYNLSRYYKSIKLTKINKIFGIEDSIEPLIVSMIIEDKLPPFTRVDQQRGLLLFGDLESKSEQDILTEHIRDVGDIIDYINNQITPIK